VNAVSVRRLGRSRRFAAPARRDQPVDRAVRWWLWNLVSGARLGTGPAMSSDRSRTTRALRGSARLAAIAALFAVAYSRNRSAGGGQADFVELTRSGRSAHASCGQPSKVRSGSRSPAPPQQRPGCWWDRGRWRCGGITTVGSDRSTWQCMARPAGPRTSDRAAT
jgi:hypothetical protein